MDLQIKGKVALVLGAGGGLGGAIASSLAAEGAKVVLADINLEAATTARDKIAATGGTAAALEWDLANLSVIDMNIATIEKDFGCVDILVNNTGGPPPTPVSGQEPDMWTRFFQSMVVSIIAITDRVLPAMKEKNWGRIITSTSSGIITPIPNLGISNSLRSALAGWSKTLAKEVGQYGITANIIVPGRIATPRISFLDEQKAKRDNRTAEEVCKESTAGIAVGRYGDPLEYGNVAAFLASGKASYITGAVIRVDGGLIPSI